MDLKQLMEILNSPAGAAGISAVGAGLSSAGERKSEEANRSQNAYQFAAQQLQRMQEAEDQNARSVLSESPLGESQQFAQRNALLGAILPGLRNQRSTPGDAGVAAAMGSRSGGLQLPEGGLNPEMLERMFGDLSTANSISQRDSDRINVNPTASTTNLSSLYGDKPEIGALSAATQGYQNNVLNERRTEADKIRAALEKDIAFQKQPEKKKGSKWGIFGKILGTVAPLAIAAIPGVGPIASAALMAGTGAASSAMQGQNPFLGAVQGGAGSFLNNAILKKSPTSYVNKATSVVPKGFN